MRLLLIRHGRSSSALPPGLVDRGAVERWLTAYDEAALATGDAPPPALVAEVARAHLIVTSDLPRAVASAALLAPGREALVSPLFREVPLPIPHSLVRRLPAVMWGALIHLRWMIEIARGRGDPGDAVERARAAARWCADACEGLEEREPVIAVATHGVFRRVLARHLRREGWRFAPGRRSYAHWSVWRMQSPR
jgi:broad specificity phosphatase PhoE